STRPPIAVVDDPLGPRRWCQVAVADQTGPGGTALSISQRRSLAGRSTWRPSVRTCGGLAVGAQHAQLGAQRTHLGEGLGDRGIPQVPAEIGEEHVAAEALAARSGLDLREVDLALGEHAQAANEPAGAVGARTPEDERGLEAGLLAG